LVNLGKDEGLPVGKVAVLDRTLEMSFYLGSTSSLPFVLLFDDVVPACQLGKLLL